MIFNKHFEKGNEKVSLAKKNRILLESKGIIIKKKRSHKFFPFIFFPVHRSALFVNIFGFVVITLILPLLFFFCFLFNLKALEGEDASFYLAVQKK